MRVKESKSLKMRMTSKMKIYFIVFGRSVISAFFSSSFFGVMQYHRCDTHMMPTFICLHVYVFVVGWNQCFYDLTFILYVYIYIKLYARIVIYIVHGWKSIHIKIQNTHSSSCHIHTYRTRTTTMRMVKAGEKGSKKWTNAPRLGSSVCVYSIRYVQRRRPKES